MKLSVVVPTYNRARLLRRLLLQLAVQTVDPASYEVVVVDDGSSPPASDSLADLRPPYALTLLRQRNGGAAAARHAGIVSARGELIVVVDDDMQVGCDFLAQHLAAHRGGREVVLGRIGADPALRAMPLFERWHANLLDRKAEGLRSGTLQAKGNLLFSGNASFRRADYLEVGGFDPHLGQSEDIELGLRLEKAGATFRFCEAARTMHGSDHASLRKWRERARRYGACDRRIGQRHAGLRHASPWRFAFELHPLTRPFIAVALLAPRAASAIAGLALFVAALLALFFGLERVALSGVSFAYALEYFRGVRDDAASRIDALRELIAFAARFEKDSRAIAPRALAALAS
jgi:glycosyltransferase involved in cell wall biosynthesis